MNLIDFVIIILVSIAFVFSIIYSIKNKASCSSCKGCLNKNCKKRK